LSFPDLQALFKECYTPAPVPVLLEEMFDVREWLKPINPQLHNISNPHVFVLTKTATGSVLLRYKKWSRDNEWHPNNSDACGIEILKQVQYSLELFICWFFEVFGDAIFEVR
jgi:hypothetical protein